MALLQNFKDHFLKTRKCFPSVSELFSGVTIIPMRMPFHQIGHNKGYLVHFSNKIPINDSSLKKN